MTVTPISYLLRQLRNSRTLKIKHGWDRNIGAGFIKEDIEKIYPIESKKIKLIFKDRQQDVAIGDLNLRETEELIAFLEKEKDNNK